MRFLLSLLRSPSSFEGDPWGFLRNQIGHGYLIGLALVLAGVPLIAVVSLYALWEAIQMLRFGGEPWDALEDTGFVAIMAVAGTLSLDAALALAGVHALFAAAGFWRRAG